MKAVKLGPVIGRCPSSSSNGIFEGQVGEVIRHSRKCRDIGVLFLFILFWIGMIVNTSFGFYHGNPLRLRYGLDYKGNVCGDKRGKPDLRGLTVRYWVNPNQVYQSGLKNSEFNLQDAKTICLKKCPVPSEDYLRWVCDYPEGDIIRLSMDQWVRRDYDYFSFLTPDMRNSSLQLQGPCYPVLFPSANVLWSCQFIVHESNVSLQQWEQMGGLTVNQGILLESTIHKSINSLSSILKRYVADIGKAWPVLIVCGGIIPLLLSMLWLLMIQHFVVAMTWIWITLILFNVLITSVTMLCYLKAGWIGNDAISPIIGNDDPYYHLSGREQGHLHVVAALMTCFMALAILLSIAIAQRIVKGPSILKVASKMIREIRTLVIFPIIPYTLLAIFYIIWFSAALHIFSSGEVVQDTCDSNCCSYDLLLKKVNCDRCCGYFIKYTPGIGVAIAFHFFGCYWATQFVKAVSSTAIAGSVASNYWALDGTLQEVALLPIISSVKRLMRYSIGSLALGSLVVSFANFTRRILKLFRRKLMAADIQPDNWFRRISYLSSQYALACFNWIIRCVNPDAYIMIAITGEGFFAASAMATDLVRVNILRIGKLNVMQDFILFLGKFCISLSSALFAFLMLDIHAYRSAHDKVSSPLFPVVVCWALGYVVATLFFAVVEISIDTIILSYCQDSEEHQGDPKYANPLLLHTLHDQDEMQRLD